MSIDLTIAPLYRLAGREPGALPGLVAATRPRSVARGREHTSLIVYLVLTGNAVFSSAEYLQTAEAAVLPFYQAPGALTSALRAGAEALNQRLLERNMKTRSLGQYAAGWLTLAALRDSQSTFLMSGPMHVFWMGQSEARHIHEPTLSGKGLGLGQTVSFHLTQAALHSNDQLVLCGRLPAAWDAPLSQASPATLQATRRRLLALTGDDLNAVLMRASDGTGSLTVLTQSSDSASEASAERKPAIGAAPAGRAATVPSPAAATPLAGESADSPSRPVPPRPQPSAYAIAPQPEQPAAREFPASIPRLGEQKARPTSSAAPAAALEASKPPPQSGPSERTRQAAQVATKAFRLWRLFNADLGRKLGRFLPRLLPGSQPADSFRLSGSMLTVMALLVPVIVVTVASTVYLRYGRSIQYETYLAEAQEARKQALAVAEPMENRTAWEAVLLNVSRAEAHRRTAETSLLRAEAEASLDDLLGIIRLQFAPAFSSGLAIEISRMAAGENDLFMLNATRGEVLHARVTSGRRFELNTAFHCAPGVYGAYTVGPLVDILALPAVSSINATLVGVDTGGNLLYCTPGKVAQAIPLAPPDTNWGRVTAMTMDDGDLYVLDAPARAVWVYAGRDGTFIDQPYFFFGGQTPEKQDVIDIAVSGDDLYMLHADGHLSTCSYSRIEAVPTRCEDPTALVNPFPAYGAPGSEESLSTFLNAHFTQALFTPPPDQSVLLLDADSQAVLRLTPRSLTMQNQLRPTTGDANPIPQGTVDAMAVSPNHALFLAINGQVYFATGIP